MRLRKADWSRPGISRRGRGRGFEYFDEGSGDKVADAETLDRIRALAIPPAWKDVWICPYPNGHLQAVGNDEAGRRQYLYHDEWRRQRDAEKFEEMLDFARRLPELRAMCVDILAGSDKPTRDRVLACAVRLLDHGFFRIGSESYAVENDTYGLATMRKDHVTIRDGRVIEFDYPAKGSKRRVTNLVDEAVLELISTLRRRRSGGDELLAYRTGDGWFDITSSDINEFIQEHLGGEYSAKDFRTWNATVLACVALAVSGQAAGSVTARKRAIVRACQEVAHYLGNTPAVARSSYIDPRVFERYEEGLTIRGALEAIGAEGAYGVPSYQGRIEQAVLDLLVRNTDADDVERVAAEAS